MLFKQFSQFSTFSDEVLLQKYWPGIYSYILGINKEEHWIKLSQIRMDKSITERTDKINSFERVFVFKCIKKQFFEIQT